MEFEAWAGQSLGACVSRGSTLRRDAPASRAADRRGASRPSPPWRRRVPERPTEVNGDRRRVSRLLIGRAETFFRAGTESSSFGPPPFLGRQRLARDADAHTATRPPVGSVSRLLSLRPARVSSGEGRGWSRKRARGPERGLLPHSVSAPETRVPDLGTTGRTETRVRSRRGPRSPGAFGHHGSHRARGDAQLR